MASMEELIERVKVATGPDEALDLSIASALVPDVVCLRRKDDDSGNEAFTHWKYTASIDDALALVDRKLPGAFWLMTKGRLTAVEPLYAAELMFGSDEILGEAEAHSAPLAILGALCAAIPKKVQQGAAS